MPQRDVALSLIVGGGVVTGFSAAFFIITGLMVLLGASADSRDPSDVAQKAYNEAYDECREENRSRSHCQRVADIAYDEAYEDARPATPAEIAQSVYDECINEGRRQSYCRDLYLDAEERAERETGETSGEDIAEAFWRFSYPFFLVSMWLIAIVWLGVGLPALITGLVLWSRLSGGTAAVPQSAPTP